MAFPFLRPLIHFQNTSKFQNSNSRTRTYFLLLCCLCICNMPWKQYLPGLLILSNLKLLCLIYHYFLFCIAWHSYLLADPHPSHLLTLGIIYFLKTSTLQKWQVTMSSIQDGLQKTNFLYLLIPFYNQVFVIILCHFHLCPFWIEVIRKG